MLARFFYSAAAAALIALTIIGFQHFYLQGKSYPGREITPPIRGLVIAHGFAMSAWLLLFFAQPLLIVKGSRRVHMMLGKVGASLAALILVMGVWVAIQSARVTPPEAKIWNLPPKQFMMVPLIAVVMFAVFVGIGVWKRHRANIHRPMMLLGTLSAMTAAISRIDAINNLFVGTIFETIFGPFFSTLVFGAILLALRCAGTRAFDRWFAAGLASLIVVFALAMQIAPTRAWDAFASLLVP